MIIQISLLPCSCSCLGNCCDTQISQFPLNRQTHFLSIIKHLRLSDGKMSFFTEFSLDSDIILPESGFEHTHSHRRWLPRWTCFTLTLRDKHMRETIKEKKKKNTDVATSVWAHKGVTDRCGGSGGDAGNEEEAAAVNVSEGKHRRLGSD